MKQLIVILIVSISLQILRCEAAEAVSTPAEADRAWAKFSASVYKSKSELLATLLKSRQALVDDLKGVYKKEKESGNLKVAFQIRATLFSLELDLEFLNETLKTDTKVSIVDSEPSRVDFFSGSDPYRRTQYIQKNKNNEVAYLKLTSLSFWKLDASGKGNQVFTSRRSFYSFDDSTTISIQPNLECDWCEKFFPNGTDSLKEPFVISGPCKFVNGSWRILWLKRSTHRNTEYIEEVETLVSETQNNSLSEIRLTEYPNSVPEIRN
ncbi:MAG: hypothetical protein WCT04_13295 [Planctomycetota bacterium]